MKVLITGGTGLLGKALIETAPAKTDITSTYNGNYKMDNILNIRYMNMNVMDKNSYNNLFSTFKPSIVIHTASIGSPDFAEKNKEITWKINVGGTQSIIDLCKKYESKIIFISSNSIYNGNNAPYGEDDIPDPINYYGITKLEGEKITKKAGIPYSIVRPILMYGWNHPFERPNIITHALKKLEKNEKIDVYSDVYSNALYSVECARAIWKIIEKNKNSSFNIAGSQKASIYKLVLEAAITFGFDKKLVSPVKQGFFNEMVKRPIDTSYKTKKMNDELGIKPINLKKGLYLMKKNGEE